MLHIVLQQHVSQGPLRFSLSIPLLDTIGLVKFCPKQPIDAHIVTRQFCKSETILPCMGPLHAEGKGTSSASVQGKTRCANIY